MTSSKPIMLAGMTAIILSQNSCCNCPENLLPTLTFVVSEPYPPGINDAVVATTEEGITITYVTDDGYTVSVAYFDNFQ